VLGSTIVLARDFGWVFRLVGHPWSIFLDDDHRRICTPGELSKELDAPVIAYDCGETTGAGYYVLASAGEIRESLSVTENGLRYFSLDGSRAAPRSFSEAAERVFCEQDAYEPGVYPEYFFSDGRTRARLVPGKKVKVGNPGFVMNAEGREFTSVPEFERVDYLAFAG
jgi:hypothetical protein